MNAAGKSRKDRVNSLSTKLSVNEEYLQVFRTKSYIEMWDKVQGQIGITTTSSSSSRISPSSSFPFYLDLSEYLLEPRQETLKEMIKSLNFHHLLIDYFGASLQACNICQLLLNSVHQTRSAYKKIKLVIKMSKKMHGHVDFITEDNYRPIFRELKSFALLKNPLSIISAVQFHDIHDDNLVLLHRLTSANKKIKRRAKLRRICKKVGGVGLVVSQTALLIALLVFAFHSILGMAAAPALIGCSLALHRKKKMERAQESAGKRLHEGVAGEQLDVAARGVFILIKDFDTMSRMVRRLHNEVEHRKNVSEMCVRIGKCELLDEVVKEFDAQERSFLEQLEELEEHIYLCLLTINRSRGLVIREIMENQ